MIEVRDLRKVYQQKTRSITALDGVDLRVEPGQIHGIIGRSGAGKSTLVRCLSGLEKPSSGQLSIDGVDLSQVSGKQLLAARRRLGMVFQHANLFSSRTAAANVSYPLELAGVPAAERRERAAELLALVGLADYQNSYPAQLSGGQRQRVAIARALATDPAVVLCDEPTSALDPQTTQEVLDLIMSLRQRLDLTVLIITHEMSVVKYCCDSVSLLQQGRIVESGPLTEVVQHRGSALASALLPLPTSLPDDVDAQYCFDLLYSSAQATEPVISTLSRNFNIDINVLAGTVEQLAGEQFAHLRLALTPDAPIENICAYLSDQGIDVVPTAEVLRLSDTVQEETL